MFLETEVAGVDEMYNRPKPLGLGGKILLNMMASRKDNRPCDTNNVCHEAEETENCKQMDEQDYERSGRKVDKQLILSEVPIRNVEGE